MLCVFRDIHSLDELLLLFLSLVRFWCIQVSWSWQNGKWTNNDLNAFLRSRVYSFLFVCNLEVHVSIFFVRVGRMLRYMARWYCTLYYCFTLCVWLLIEDNDDNGDGREAMFFLSRVFTSTTLVSSSGSRNQNATKNKLSHRTRKERRVMARDAWCIHAKGSNKNEVDGMGTMSQLSFIQYPRRKFKFKQYRSSHITSLLPLSWHARSVKSTTTWWVVRYCTTLLQYHRASAQLLPNVLHLVQNQKAVVPYIIRGL